MGAASTPVELALLIGGLGALCVSIPMLLIGLRGRKLNNHPVCRPCGFDLSGIDTGGARECPECGGSLSLPKAIRIGERARLKRLILGASIVLIAGTLASAAGAWRRLGSLDWQSLKPFSMVAAQAASPRPVAMDAAIRELGRRWSRGSLSDGQVKSVIDLGISLQGDADGPWDPAWADLVESMRRAGRLSAEQSAQFVRQMMTCSMAVPKEVIGGSVVSPRIVLDGGRGPRDGTRRLTARLTAVKLGTVTVPVDEAGDIRVPAVPGVHTLFAEWSMTVREDGAGDSGVIATWTEPLESRVTIKPEPR